MYQLFKSFLKKILPLNILFKREEYFRFIFGIWYHGKNYKCNICNHSLRKFVFITTEDKLCPYCGSLSRTRRLYDLLQNTYKLKGKVLHFSPSRCLYRRLKKNTNISYYSSDFENQFISDYNFDITNIPIENDFFEFIICYHILEHIIDDQKAIKELYRVLKPNGIILVQTPYKLGDIYEDYTIITPEDRLKNFGQEDHVRIYSVNGLEKRMKANNFKKINVMQFTLVDKKTQLLGLQKLETIFELKK